MTDETERSNPSITDPLYDRLDFTSREWRGRLESMGMDEVQLVDELRRVTERGNIKIARTKVAAILYLIADKSGSLSRFNDLNQ